MADYSPKSRV